MKNLFNNRKVLFFTLIITIISILTLTVAYAALSTVLEIKGNAEVAAANWDIHLDNVKVDSASNGTTVPTITSATTVSFTTTLNKPGDYYAFTIDVVNDGTIDAMIDSVTKIPELTIEQAKYINYIVEYENGESISTKQLVPANSFVRIKVLVEYRKDISISDLPTSSTILDLSFKVNYLQSDESNENKTILNNGRKTINVVSGDLDTLGSEICIIDECFYVLSSTEEDVTMLAKMNITLSDEPKQNTVVTKTQFSSESQKGTNYTDYDGSIVEIYVQNYVRYLENFGLDIKDSRLITKHELEGLGCQNGYCNAAPSWIYATEYWTGTNFGEAHIYVIFTSSMLGFDSYGTARAIRPVVTISKSEF